MSAPGAPRCPPPPPPPHRRPQYHRRAGRGGRHPLVLALLVVLLLMVLGAIVYLLLDDELVYVLPDDELPERPRPLQLEQPVPAGTYPWMVAVIEDGEQVCGATVILERWILTAAHCLVDDHLQPHVPVDALTFAIDTVDWTRPGQVLTATEIVPHPDYDPVTTDNDIALVHVAEAAQVAPVFLATTDDRALERPPTVGRVIGYGVPLNGGEAPLTLMQVDVDVTDFAGCNALYDFSLVESTMLCAGNPSDDPDMPGPDSCEGDSGGPLFVDTIDGPVQVGVVSFGSDVECGVDLPGVYALVSAYFDWIEGETGERVSTSP